MTCKLKILSTLVSKTKFYRNKDKAHARLLLLRVVELARSRAVHLVAAIAGERQAHAHGLPRRRVLREDTYVFSTSELERIFSNV